MATDIDMEIDMTLDEDPELARLNAEAAAIEERRVPTNSFPTLQRAQQAQAEDAMRDVQAQAEEGEVDTSEPQPTKVFLRGFDHFWKPNDLRNYVRDTAKSVDELFKRIEWINDTSANLIYETEDAAAEALGLLSVDEVLGETLQEREAKRPESHPESQLYVRQAVVGDVKMEKAAQYSKFYLYNPQFDPSERKRKREEDHRQRSVYRKREGYGRRRHEEEPFDVNLYDDDEPATQPRRNSVSSGSADARPKHPRRKLAYDDEDLFASKQTGRLRGARSASPNRDGDGKYGFAENEGATRRQTARAVTPPLARGSRNLDNRVARDVLKTELFPNKGSGPDLFPNKSRLTTGGEYDLFPGRSNSTARQGRPREGAFPSSPSHRRQDAQDMKLIDVAEQIGKYNLDGAVEPSLQGSRTYREVTGRAPSQTRNGAGKGSDLFSRVTGGPTAKSSDRGRLNGQDPPGFSFKGAATGGNRSQGASGAAGFSIRGASREQVENPLVKELFPLKAGTDRGGKDLFDGRIKGRGRGKRMGADDLI
ncbi:hypothetical protein K431DRAFT_345476 [Polychaeton citri CBS 116435]|uniref:Uncharacterized protein n=1 Tax=Polychaeton citri CBS 116435 TaxID=1314669 RepID=A0A9P4UQ49_9PEZI|nr:hypothetical protein K431DRAFT_345476 [Polychaeton citri CBS 116435]